MSRITVRYNSIEKTLDCSSGENLFEFLRSRGFDVPAACGGNGSCGKCMVDMICGGKRESVQSCRTAIPAQDFTVELSSKKGGISWNDASAFETGSEKREGMGIAADLGTTTIALSLYDLSTGTMLGTESEWNVQESYGADVITRISYCMEHPEGLKTLQGKMREQICSMAKKLCIENGCKFEDLKEIFLAGNTVMQHIFAGIRPESLAQAPFTVPCFFDDGKADDFYGVPLYYPPCVAAYVGGDITAGLLGADIYKKEGINLFIDIGTNGEMALGGTQGFCCCAVASGPAFEAAGISCGMPAAKGAVCSVRISADGEGLEYDVIGDAEPAGLCGSGLLDLTACLIRLGMIDESGALEEDENGEAVFRLTDKVYITQRDVRSLQLAKAAVAAGIRVLLEEGSLPLSAIDHLYLAGGFGTRLDPESAAAIGMLPQELINKTVPVGNSGLAGAAKALLNPSQRSILCSIRESCKYTELSSNQKFNDYYIDSMSFPEAEYEY